MLTRLCICDHNIRIEELRNVNKQINMQREKKRNKQYIFDIIELYIFMDKNAHVHSFNECIHLVQAFMFMFVC